MVLNKGFETNTLRWSEKAKVAKKRNVPISAIRETKFGTGYFASSGLSQVLVTKPKPIDQNPTGSNSDMEISSGSDDETVIKRFVVISSPEDHVVLRPKETSKEDELSDSATSTEISYGCNSSGIGQKDIRGNGFEKDMVFHYADTPSAPPLFELGPKISQSSVDWVSSSERHVMSDQNVNSTIPSVHNGLREPESFLSIRTGVGSKINGSTTSLPARLPGFQPRLSCEQGTFCSVVSYDACVRLCLHEWALRGCSEVHCFLQNECAMLRDTFGLRHVLLQSEDELMGKRSTELVSQVAGQKSRKTSGKIKLQVRRVKIGSEPIPSCFGLSSLDFPMIEDESLKRRYLYFKSTMSSTFKSIRKVRVAPQVPANSSISQRSLAYLEASTKYLKMVSKLLEIGAGNFCNSSSQHDQVVQETYCCLLKLKSSSDEDTIRLRPGSGEDHVFFPDGLGDYLVVEVQDSKGRHYGRVLAQVAAIADNPDEKLKWWPIYSDPEHETVGRVQLFINYTTTQSETSHPKCGSVAETTAYDFLLEVAFKDQQFHQRNLVLKGPWRWLVTEFASYYGVSDAYTKLRYLSYVMDVATPTEYCLNLVYELLSHVLMKGNRNTLSHQEKRILAETEDQVKDTLALVFENYKSLDEYSPSGMLEVFMPSSGSVAPALAPAVRLYSLLHDIFTPEAQLKLCRYFQAATQKRLRRHLAETEEFTSTKNEGMSIDLPTSYEKMKSLILNIRNEVFTDMKIHNQHVLPSFIELPNISSSLYTVELSSRLRAFLIACPPPGPSRPVSQLVIAAADFQRDLSLWNIKAVNGSVDVKDLFNSHIIRWIQDKRHGLLDLCKQEKVKSCSVGAQQPSRSPFLDEMFDHLVETINEYQVILCRWPEYISLLENAIADVEKAIVDAVEKHFADVLSPLKDTLTNKILGHKYVQRLSKGAVNTYLIPDELGILLNSMRRLLDVLCPKIENQLKSWRLCVQDDGRPVIGEHLNDDVKVMLRAKFRSYSQAIVEKLADNTKVQNSTKLKNIIRDSKDSESSLRSRMDPLKDLLTKAMCQLDTVVETPVFIQICRELWERMGQDVLHILEDGKEKRSWYKGLRLAVSILDEIFASEMQKLRGNSLKEKDLEPPGSIKEIHSMLCKDTS